MVMMMSVANLHHTSSRSACSSRGSDRWATDNVIVLSKACDSEFNYYGTILSCSLIIWGGIKSEALPLQANKMSRIEIEIWWWERSATTEELYNVESIFCCDYSSAKSCVDLRPAARHRSTTHPPPSVNGRCQASSCDLTVTVLDHQAMSYIARNYYHRIIAKRPNISHFIGQECVAVAVAAVADVDGRPVNFLVKLMATTNKNVWRQNIIKIQYGSCD